MGDELAALSTAALFVSGAVMSIRKSPGERMLRVHNLAAAIAVVAGGAGVWLLQ